MISGVWPADELQLANARCVAEQGLLHINRARPGICQSHPVGVRFNLHVAASCLELDHDANSLSVGANEVVQSHTRKRAMRDNPGGKCMEPSETRQKHADRCCVHAARSQDVDPIVMTSRRMGLSRASRGLRFLQATQATSVRESRRTNNPGRGRTRSTGSQGLTASR